MNADGSDLTRLTDDPGLEQWPDWSPDGTKIAYRHKPLSGDGDIYVVNPDGSQPTQLTTTGDNAGPAWSPDGTRIMYDRLSDEGFGLYVMKADGSNSTSVTIGFLPDWQPLTSPEPRRASGDFDGDGRTDVAVFRPSGGFWFVHDGVTTQFGTDGDVPVPGDYDGDGDGDGDGEIAVFRPSAGVWVVQGGAATQYSAAGNIPVPGDYDGDGRADIAVLRPSTGTHHVLNGSPDSVPWGTEGDIPLPVAS